jgi:hypothetical protein
MLAGVYIRVSTNREDMCGTDPLCKRWSQVDRREVGWPTV